jgi:hypothetical protein
VRTGKIESSSEPPSEGLAAWSREEDMWGRRRQFSGRYGIVMSGNRQPWREKEKAEGVDAMSEAVSRGTVEGRGRFVAMMQFDAGRVDAATSSSFRSRRQNSYTQTLTTQHFHTKPPSNTAHTVRTDPYCQKQTWIQQLTSQTLKQKLWISQTSASS